MEEQAELDSLSQYEAELRDVKFDIYRWGRKKDEFTIALHRLDSNAAAQQREHYQQQISDCDVQIMLAKQRETYLESRTLKVDRKVDENPRPPFTPRKPKR